MKKILPLMLIIILVSSVLTGCGNKSVSVPKAETVKLNLGNLISETDGNTNQIELKFANDTEMLATMKMACENDKYELYYHEDNMSVALKDKQSGKIMLSNPFNAASDQNYSGNVANRLNSQVIVTYLEEEKSLVEMYSSVDCSDLGQYKIKTYDNGLEFVLSIGEEKDNSNVPTVIPKKRYEEICNALDDSDKELLEMYYVLTKKSELKDSGIYEVYPDVKTEDLYYCNLELSEREMIKVSAVFETAKYTADKIQADAKELNLGKTGANYPNFKLTLNYSLTDNGVKVTIPNKSISFNEDFPLLKVSILPYFGADEASENANGYLFIPDGSGAVINMNQNEPNRRTIITGKVYGENASKLPKKEATEKTEQYYLPVFGTVRNNNSAIFGIITNGDANAEITALLGRPNGNYYTTYPEFLIADYEKYTRVSVVNNAWSNQEMYLYDKNKTQEDLSIEYYLLNETQANYSYMAKIYSNYIFGESKAKANKSVLNIETLGSVLTDKTFLGFEYKDEAILTSYEDNVEIIKQLKENNADNLSLQLRGWQKDGLNAIISNRIRTSSALGGKSGLNKLTEYCNKQKIDLSVYNNISFVNFDNSFDGFKPKADATHTLELQYAFDTAISPATMQSYMDSYVVKASSYSKFLKGLTDSAKGFSLGNLNLGKLGDSLNADYTKDNCINRSETLRYIVKVLKDNENGNLSFDGGNAYVLPYAKTVSYISNENSGFIGETASVPFLQMVIGTNASYNSKPINLKENTRQELLNCIESGTTPTYLISFDNTSALKSTAYTEYFSVDYNILKNEILESYKYVEKAFSKTNGSSVIGHKVLTNDVAVITYENGIEVYVNKSLNDFTAEGITIPAMDYVIKE